MENLIYKLIKIKLQAKKTSYIVFFIKLFTLFEKSKRYCSDISKISGIGSSILSLSYKVLDFTFLYSFNATILQAIHSFMVSIYL